MAVLGHYSERSVPRSIASHNSLRLPPTLKSYYVTRACRNSDGSYRLRIMFESSSCGNM